MKKEQLNLRDRLEFFGVILFFVFYLSSAGVKLLFEKTKKTVKEKIYNIQNRTKQRG